MKQFIKIFYLIILVIPISCSIDFSYRNRIEFKEPIANVQDSIKILNSFLLRMKTGLVSPTYFVEDSTIYFDFKLYKDRLISEYDREVLDTIEAFNVLSVSENKRMLNLMKYLNQNYLSGVFRKNNSDQYYYVYHVLPMDSYDSHRAIMLLPDTTKSEMQLATIAGQIGHTTRSKVLDIEKSLVLYAHINAEIFD